ncbi:MAG: M23 family metallopeptidase, partial [Pseudomonadota bacterium]|nr:M23 family metallopeptidase [Pseudomonadota bacterium]
VWQFLNTRNLKSAPAALVGAPADLAAPRPPANQSAQAATKAVPSFSENKRFDLPIDCIPGRDCWVPNYVDALPGKGARDYAGGVRTYENHKGVDFAIRDQRAMMAGVTVRAAAGGVVRAIRDTMADVDFKLLKPETIKGRECGNAVVVQHDPDWRSQYCHMRSGSVAVARGQRVKAYTTLGLVGLSGKTEFPHLHFMVFFKDKPVDPFTGLTVIDGTKVAGNLWRDEARTLLRYRETNIYHAGFAAETPKFQAARRGEYNRMWLVSPVRELFVWMDIFGVHDGDRVIVWVIGSGGRELASRRLNLRLKRPRARQFLQIGFKHEGGFWPAGSYESKITLARSVGRETRKFRVTRRVTIN